MWQGTSLEAEEEDSQPLSVLREKIAEQQKVVPHNPIQGNAVIDLTTSENSLPPPPKLQLAPGISGISELLIVSQWLVIWEREIFSKCIYSNVIASQMLLNDRQLKVLSHV